ncbi:MAG TPA: uroporphyrinogen decarboxylase family protein [Candidatus Hydrogenedentes bacterium]|jgi:uroporphyrinogen decarboxylase|nr:uroporphyrinogen decarboxylase family protein [Candidatus Hydrogenedentota bacterium]HPJ98840.1 uroporphyrinogen decarboxylase family protein [Candidatus Hydrogenedentota bacterium]
MNSYERYMGMVKGEKVDFVPRVPILMHFAARYAGVTYGDFARDAATLVAVNRKLIEDFGFEQLDIMSDPWRETVDFGGTIEYLDDAVPKCTRHPLADSRDLGMLLQPDPQSSERMSNALRALALYKDFGYKQYSITGWVEGPAAEAATLRGVANFLMDLMTEEEFAGNLMDRCVVNAVAFAQAQLEKGADTIGIGDAIASQLSPELYGRFVFPREKQLIDAIHAAGGLVRLHICGDINHLLSQIALLNVDILDCDWMVDMAAARKILGSRVVLTGNLDPVQAVMEATPQAIRDTLRAIYDTVGNPYFVNAGCEIPAATPLENLRALCEPIPAA